MLDTLCYGLNRVLPPPFHTTINYLFFQSIPSPPNQESPSSQASTLPAETASPYQSIADEPPSKTAIRETEMLTDISGRYLLQSSEGFDEVLVALGVGMMKRKMATSVAPANVIEVADDGQFSVTIYFFTSILF